jgi:hypothetical protein
MSARVAGIRSISRILFVCGSAFVVCLLCGCQTSSEKRPPAVNVGQIIEMSKGGVPAQDIIRKIHESGTVYRLRASELARLREQGVPDDVIDYMQETHLEATRHEQYFHDWSYGPDGYWYGGYPFGWPYWDVVIVRGGHERHEEHERHERYFEREEHEHKGEIHRR